MSRKTVLIVDEGHLARVMMKAVIKLHHLDWQVLEAANAADALDMAENRWVDVIAMDEDVPGADGLELGRRLRAKLPNARISLITRHVATTSLPEAADAGLRLMPKPLTDERIRELVDAA